MIYTRCARTGRRTIYGGPTSASRICVRCSSALEPAQHDQDCWQAVSVPRGARVGSALVNSSLPVIEIRSRTGIPNRFCRPGSTTRAVRTRVRPQGARREALDRSLLDGRRLSGGFCPDTLDHHDIAAAYPGPWVGGGRTISSDLTVTASDSPLNDRHPLGIPSSGRSRITRFQLTPDTRLVPSCDASHAALTLDAELVADDVRDIDAIIASIAQHTDPRQLVKCVVRVRTRGRILAEAA